MLILETKGLSINFGGLQALRDLDLKIRNGEIFGLIGPNGAGKTTCFNVITGFLKPSSGGIVFKGESITGLEPYAIAGKGLVRTFQITNVFPNLSAEENVVIGRHLRTAGNMWGAVLRSRRYREQEKKLRERAGEILDLLGFDAKKHVVAKNLPYGEERKLEIAIALACEPAMLLLDEPAAGLSPEECSKLITLIRSIRGRGVTILVVEHNMKVVMEVCENVAVLNYGVKIAEGSPQAIVNNEKVISVYLGRKDGNSQSI